jgi:hypothetical protein
MPNIGFSSLRFLTIIEKFIDRIHLAIRDDDAAEPR